MDILNTCIIFFLLLLIARALDDPYQLSYDLQAYEWSIQSDGRCPCQFKFRSIQQSTKFHLGRKCKGLTHFPTSFFESFAEYHLQRDDTQHSRNPNFEKLMLFDVRLVMKIDFDYALALQQLGKEMNDSPADAPLSSSQQPVVYTHLTFGSYISKYIPMNQTYVRGLTTYDNIIGEQRGTDSAEENNIKYVQYDFDYNLAWSPNYRPSQYAPVELELDFEDFHQRLSLVANDDPRRIKFNQLMKVYHVVVERLEVRYVIQPKRFDFNLYHAERCQNPSFVIMEEERKRQQAQRDHCYLLGTNCAVVLRRQYISRELPIHEVSPFSSAEEARCTDHHIVNDVPESIPTSSPSYSGAQSSVLPRIFCGIFTKASNHESHVKVIRDTWARKCTGFLAFSTIDDPSLPSINLPHIGEEMYNNMWQKSRSIWKYIATHYLQDYDWFLLGGDDMYYIMENLYQYVSSDEILQIQRNYSKMDHANSEEQETSYMNDKDHRINGLYIGRILREPASTVFNATDYNTGGPGYLLDSRALHVLMDNIDQQHCYPFHQHSGEDVYLSDCLLHSKPSIIPYNTTDKLGRHRFLLYPAGSSYSYNLNDRRATKHWLLDYDPYVKSGHDCCSDDVISIHFVNGLWMFAMDDFLYRCPAEQIDSYFAEHGNDFFDREVIADESGRRS